MDDHWQQKYPASLLKCRSPGSTPDLWNQNLWRVLTLGGAPQLWPELPQTLEQVLQEGYYGFSPEQLGVETGEMVGQGGGEFALQFCIC